jgi:hypothetical protein
MAIGVRDNQQPDDLEAREGVYVTPLPIWIRYYHKCMEGRGVVLLQHFFNLRTQLIKKYFRKIISEGESMSCTIT